MPTQTSENPKHGGEKPPFDEHRQQPPGHERDMRHKPDHGERSYKGLGRLQDKVALITGADSGIGRAVAIAMAREGADIVMSYLPEEDEDSAETLRWIEDAGRRALRFPGDIRHEHHCREMVERAAQEFGRLDVLVNNAAYQMSHGDIEELSSEEWDHTFRTNIYSMFYLSKAALPHMREGGAIINTASVQAYHSKGHLLAYASTKGAIVSFTKALADLAIQRGVRVNAVAPGPVWTPLIPSTMPDEKVENFGKDTAFERPAQPAELAPAYVFLAAVSESPFITGSVLDITGGRKLP